MSWSIIVLPCVLVYSWYSVVNAQCKLKFPNNRERTPIFELSLGTRSVKIPYTEEFVYLEEGERITGFCPTVFNDFHYVLDEPTFDAYGVFNQHQPEVRVIVTGEHNVSMHCHNQTLFYLGSSDHSLEKPLYEDQLSCGELKWSIFEVNKAFSWCSPPLGSYALAARFFAQELVLGVLCYDVEQMELRALHYTLEAKLIQQHRNNFHIFISRPSTFVDVQLGEEISNFDTIFKLYSFKLKNQKDDITETRFYNELDNESRQNSWIKICGYEYRPIVQAGPYANYFHMYVDVLDVLWWPSLRFGNWLKFQEMLIQRANNYTFNLFAGTTGGIQLPDRSKYNFRNSNKTIPAYIWVYAEARETDEQILVFGYNSPYYDFFTLDEIIFCDDICNTISWLESIRIHFRRPALGIVFCCAVDPVITNNFQADLPFESLLRKSSQKTATSTNNATSKGTTETTTETTRPDEVLPELMGNFF